MKSKLLQVRIKETLYQNVLKNWSNLNTYCFSSHFMLIVFNLMNKRPLKHFHIPHTLWSIDIFVKWKLQGFWWCFQFIFLKSDSASTCW
jgi:hypothetical protein